MRSTIFKLLTTRKNSGIYFTIKDELEEDGMDEEEKLVGELAKLQTIMMILEGKEEYEKAAIILKKINKINNKLNNGSGKY